jgi:phosphopantetheine adenylyltransferase
VAAVQQTSAELIMRGLRDVAQMQAEQRAVNQVGACASLT